MKRLGGEWWLHGSAPRHEHGSLAGWPQELLWLFLWRPNAGSSALPRAHQFRLVLDPIPCSTCRSVKERQGKEFQAASKKKAEDSDDDDDDEDDGGGGRGGDEEREQGVADYERAPRRADKVCVAPYTGIRPDTST